jgi:hypothetical protein
MVKNAKRRSSKLQKEKGEKIRKIKHLVKEIIKKKSTVGNCEHPQRNFTLSI